MDDQNLEHKIGTSGLIVFDGACGSCSVFIGERRTFFEKYGFSIAPLQQPWVRELTKLSEESLLQAIHLYLPDHQIVSGIDFFLIVTSKVWWLTPMNLVMRIDSVKPLFAWLYNMVAKRRRRLSKICGLQSRAIYK